MDTAIVVCPRNGLPEEGLLDLNVGGLGLVTRALLTAQHAGFERLLVVASAEQQAALRPQVATVPRLAGRVRWADAVSSLEPLPAHSLVIVPMVLLQPGALRAWRQRVETLDGATCLTGFEAGPWAVPPALLPACVHAGREGLAGWQRFRDHAGGHGHLAVVPWEGAGPEAVRAARDVSAVERRMLRTQRSAEDGPLVDRFINRTISERISRLLIRWPITPNQITLASLLTGLIAAWLLTYERMATTLLGLFLFQVSVVLDHVDGEIARLKFQFSRLGKWLDNFSDHVVDLAVITCLAWRVAVAGEAGSVAALGVAAAIGVTGSFLVVFWWSVAGQHDSTPGKARRGVETLTAMANRDGFCLALWATLLIGRPAWFLWTLAVGSNLFWILWLVICGTPATTNPDRLRTGRTKTRPVESSSDDGADAGRP